VALGRFSFFGFANVGAGVDERVDEIEEEGEIEDCEFDELKSSEGSNEHSSDDISCPVSMGTILPPLIWAMLKMLGLSSFRV
jgi:hypothetical protein